MAAVLSAEQRRSTEPGGGRTLQVAASAFLAVAWLLVLVGLFLLPKSHDPVLDVEAGGRFAYGLFVYLPALVLSVVLLVCLPRLALARFVGGGLAPGVAVAGFIGWVLIQRPLVDYIPGLEKTMWMSGIACLTALVMLVAPELLRRGRVQPDI